MPTVIWLGLLVDSYLSLFRPLAYEEEHMENKRPLD